LTETPLQILVTNDDGLDSVGLHELARAMIPHGTVTVVAPDREFSGSGASIGTILDNTPEVHRARIDGIDTVWSVSGPPALCVLYARLGAFGFTPDLVVSGINPGANVGRAVYHSGTVGAALTARTGGIPGVAVSQAIDAGAVEGQAWRDIVADLDWNTASTIASHVVGGMIAADLVGPGVSELLRTDAPVLNVNVPDRALTEITGWSWTSLGISPSQSMRSVTLVPKAGHVDSYKVEFDFGPGARLEPGTDTNAMADGVLSLTWLSRIDAVNGQSSAIDTTVSSWVERVIGRLG
jgi:5'-nucleotidase